MAATPDRTTIKVALAEMLARLRANLLADPPTADKPFRRVAEGHTYVTEYPRPFLAVSLQRTKVVSVTDNDKVIEVHVTLRAVTDIPTVDPHDRLLDLVGAVDDYLDSIVDSGMVEGAEGFDDRAWSFDYPRETAGARVASAEANQTFVVKVEREQNRVPAS